MKHEPQMIMTGKDEQTESWFFVSATVRTLHIPIIDMRKVLARAMRELDDDEPHDALEQKSVPIQDHARLPVSRLAVKGRLLGYTCFGSRDEAMTWLKETYPELC